MSAVSRRRRGLALVALALVALTLGWAAPADAQQAGAPEAGSIAWVRNDVRGTPPGSAERALAAGEGFTLGYSIATGPASAAQMTFDPRGSLRLGARTRITIDQAAVTAAGRGEARLSLGLGALWVALSRLFNGDLEVETPSATIGIKGTLVGIEVDEAGRTLVVVIEGEVTVRAKAGGVTVLVPEGFETVVDPGEPPTLPAPIDLSLSILGSFPRGPGFTAPPEELWDPIPDPVLPRLDCCGLVGGPPP